MKKLIKGLAVSSLLCILLCGVFTISGCGVVHKTYLLSETESYYFIPAGTPFNAVVEKGKPPVEVVRVKDTWAVDSGYLAKLQEEANAAVLTPRK